ncbi:hypothetical protein LQL77_07145 [Rhodococcus cerastii]|nr:hypothetical protein [Rhodococcus cerastii]
MWWWKQRRDARRGREEAERAYEKVKSQDPYIAELGRQHRLTLETNGFGEAVEIAMGRRKRGHA